MNQTLQQVPPNILVTLHADLKFLNRDSGDKRALRLYQVFIKNLVFNFEKT